MSEVFTDIISPLNKYRNDLWTKSHNNTNSIADRAGCWLGHKAVTVISIPANAALTSICLAGMAATASTIGVIKAAIFAGTLGHVKLPIPTGFQYFAESGISPCAHLFVNTGEILADAGFLLYDSCRVIKWIGIQLHLENIVRRIFHEIGRFFEFVFKRIGDGFEKACKDEKDWSWETPTILKPFDEETKQYRIEESKSVGRPLKDIAVHTFYSLVNIPANTVVAVIMALAIPMLGGAFIGKVVFSTVTGLKVPGPTYANRAIGACLKTTYNAGADTVNIIADGFVMIYKTAEVLRITKVVATVFEVIKYIPEACFAT